MSKAVASAKYAGVCKTCKQLIAVGDVLRRNAAATWVHSLDCADKNVLEPMPVVDRYVDMSAERRRQAELTRESQRQALRKMSRYYR